jgi:RimJ/RimL family protein N-acetyltransferase
MTISENLPKNDVVFLKGERIHLRSLEESDLNERYLQWLNDEEVCQYNSHAIFPNTINKMHAYFNSLQNQQYHVVLAIIHTETKKHIGNVSLQNINWVSRTAEFATILGDKEFWGGGIGAEAGKLMVKYGFERLNLHRIYFGAFAESVGVQKLAKALCMTEEGRRRQAFYKNGSYHDIIEYGVLRNEYREQ